MDYMKDGNSNILLDSENLPVGYIQRLSDYNTHMVDNKKLITSGGVTGVRFDRNQVATFLLYTIGDGFYGVGVVEPVYSVALLKKDLERGMAHNVHRLLGLLEGIVGDATHEPTGTQADNLLKKLQGINYKSEIVHPYYERVGMISGSETIRVIPPVIELLRSMIVSTIGPKALITGSSESSTRQTLATQNRVMQRRIVTLQTKVSDSFKHIFTRISEVENWPEIPKLVPKSRDVNDLNDKSTRLSAYVKSGVLLVTPELVKHILKEEGIGQDE